MPHSIVIADDHPVVLSGLSALISSEPEFAVVGTATDGRRALALIANLTPEMVVLDINMPLMTGLDVLKTIVGNQGAPRIVLLAATLADAEIFDAYENGAAGILFKDAAASTLMDCLSAVAEGKRWFHGETIESAIASEMSRRRNWQQLSSRLTEREVEVVALIVEGTLNKEIAYKLQISEGTTKVHLNNIFRKLGVTSRAELISVAPPTASNGP